MPRPTFKTPCATYFSAIRLSQGSSRPAPLPRVDVHAFVDFLSRLISFIPHSKTCRPSSDRPYSSTQTPLRFPRDNSLKLPPPAVEEPPGRNKDFLSICFALTRKEGSGTLAWPVFFGTYFYGSHKRKRPQKHATLLQTTDRPPSRPRHKIISQ